MMYFLFSLCVFICASALADLQARHYVLEDAESYFEEFIIKYNKHYADEQEKATRFEIFKSKLEKINQLNKRSKLATHGITPHIDLTPEEFFKMRKGLKDSSDGLCDTVLKDQDIIDINAPESFDWREHGAVTSVKNQGNCGSCYAFGTIANVESQYFMKHKILVELSEQEIVDCDKMDSGCDGGIMANALGALQNLGGVVLESDYPYRANVSQCKLDKSKIVVKLSGCISYDLKSQEKLKQALYKTGPIVVGIQGSIVETYEGGIIEDSECIGKLDHAVLLVGYGKDPQKNNEPYWILKNSWGSGFGEAGYFRLQRSDNVNGACGMMNDAMASAVVQ